MVRRYLIRYVILLLILIMCAGAALYFAETSPKSHEDAVLAFYVKPETQKTEAPGDMERMPGKEADGDILKTWEPIARTGEKEAVGHGKRSIVSESR